MDLITADGGFDFSMDFNQQEILIGKLLFAQIAYALCLQKRGGKFILKIFVDNISAYFNKRLSTSRNIRSLE